MDRDAPDAERAVPRTPQRASRRVILKAAAAFGVLAAWRSGGADSPVFAAGTTRARRVDDTRPTDTVTAADASGYRVVSATFPFSAVGVSWPGATRGTPRIELSFSMDGSRFTRPVFALADSTDGGRPNRDGRVFSQLVFANGMRYIRYRVLDGNGEVARIAGLEIVYIDASDGPRDSGHVVAAEAPTLKKPAVLSRAGWGANESYRFSGGTEIFPRKYQEVEHVIVHHTATSNEQDPHIEIRSIYYYHAVERGWGDIGYNYVIGQNGTIFEGRYGGDNVVGSHASEYNAGSCGISAIGTYTTVDVSSATRTSLVAMTAWVARHLDPLGHKTFHGISDLPTICGHRDVGDTECPGGSLWDDLTGIRQAVAAIHAATKPLPASEIPPSEMEFQPGDNVIFVGQTNLRDFPSPTAKVVRRIVPGVIAAVMDDSRVLEGRHWFEIRQENGSYGFVLGKYLDQAPIGNPPKPTLDAGDQVVANVGELRLRRYPGVAQDAPHTVSKATPLRISAGSRAATGAQWYKGVASGNQSGWVMQQEVKLARARKVALSLQAGPANKSVKATITAFPAGSTVVISVGGVQAASAMVAASGNGSVQFRIPYLPKGVHTVTARSGNAATTTKYEVQPRLDLNPSSGLSNATVSVRLSGYPANATASVQWRKGSTWESFAAVTLDGAGSARVSAMIPLAASGTISMRAVSGSASAIAPFTVTGAGVASVPEPTATTAPTLPAAPPAPPEQTPTPNPTDTPTPAITPSVVGTPEPTSTEVPAAEPTAAPTELTAEAPPEPTPTSEPES